MNRSFRKIDPEKLHSYVAEYPQAYQSEMAKEFQCSESGIRNALKRLKITRKKESIRYQEQNAEKVAAYQREIKKVLPEKLRMWMNAELTPICIASMGMCQGDRRYSAASAVTNINAVELLLLNWMEIFRRHFSLVGLWTAHYLSLGLPVSCFLL